MTVDEFERAEKIDTAKRRECNEVVAPSLFEGGPGRKRGHEWSRKEPRLTRPGPDPDAVGYVCLRCGEREVRSDDSWLDSFYDALDSYDDYNSRG